MSIKVLCKNQCANYINGICLGAIINRDLSQMIDIVLSGKSCCVDQGRCNYFENIIIQLVRISHKHPDYLQMSKALNKYEVKYFGMGVVRHCRECKKPTPDMKKNQKYCTDCANKRRLKSKRNHKRLQRRKSE